MKFGVREICDVVLKAKATQKIGNKVFYKNEPVIYFDTLKTSSMEGSATTVYAQGGRGNSRLMAWEGERTVTFTMEDALISPEGFMILSGAGLVDAEEKTIYQHVTERIDMTKEGSSLEKIYLSNEPHLPVNDTKDAGNFAYVMLVKNDEIVSEPIIPAHGVEIQDENGKWYISCKVPHDIHDLAGTNEQYDTDLDDVPYDSVIVDYYTPRRRGAKQIEITPDKFGGNYYLEASTLFRDTNGVDMPAEFIIPNCKIQSNFTFTMASSGDPSTFTFTMDAFPDYTRFDNTKKVLAAIQIIKEAGSQSIHRHSTKHEAAHDLLF